MKNLATSELFLLDNDNQRLGIATGIEMGILGFGIGIALALALAFYRPEIPSHRCPGVEVCT